MKKRHMALLIAIMTLQPAFFAQAEQLFYDDFNTPHDYLVDGVIGVGWDGFIGLGENETVDVLDANITNAPRDANLTGYLYMQSTGGNWDNVTPMGPLLYKMVSGDFTAEVEVVDFEGCWGSEDVLHNNSGILVRVPNLADAGEGEDSVNVEYFPTWCGNMIRDIDDGGKDVFACSLGSGCVDTRFLQLERAGNQIHCRVSTNGTSWTALTDSPRPREDMAGFDLQVGLMHSTYLGTTGYVAFDNFYLYVPDAFPPNPYARSPIPPDGATKVSFYTNLRWKAGDYVQAVNGHELYISTDFDDVNDSNETVKVVLTDANYIPPGGSFDVGKTYYWAVDEVNEASKWEGEVWSFETAGKATDPIPFDGEGGVEISITEVQWTPSIHALSQDFHWGTSREDVESATVPEEGGLAGDANSVLTPTTPPLEPGERRYWRIDSNCGQHGIAKGDVWRFTVQNYSPIDKFEPYTASGHTNPGGTPPADTLRSVWVDGYYTYTYASYPPYNEVTPATSGSYLQLNIDPADGEDPLTYLNYQPEDIAQSPAKSMKFYYDNDGTVTVVADLYFHSLENPPYVYAPSPDTYLSEVYAAIDAAAAGSGLDSLDMERDWSSYKLLKLSFYGDPNNTVNNAGMYVGLQDDSGDTLVTIPHTDANELVEPWWHDWYIAMSEFTDKDPELDLTGIARIYIGFGDKDSPSSGGTGLVFIDDIQLLAYSVCIPENAPAGDLNEDCMVNYDDLKIMAEEWLTTGIKADIIDNDNVDGIDFAVLANDLLIGPVLLGD